MSHGDSTLIQNKISVLAWVDLQHQFLLDTYQLLLTEPNRKTISRILYQAHQIQSLCRSNDAGLLAALQLNRTTRYARVKELYAAVLAEVVGAAAGMKPASRLQLVCAALTQDIGMLDLQESKLDNQTTVLTPNQRKMIRKHPLTSRSILERAEVRESIWLEAVAQHHERLDGEGYPLGLAGEAISNASRLLTLVDMYVAMMRPRGDRPAMIPKQAMKEIFLARGRKVDIHLARIFIDTLGMYPPGSSVRLVNGEIGIVRKGGKGPAFPQVATILSSEGEHLQAPVLRDTAERNYTVVEMLPTPFHFNLSALLGQLWPSVPSSGRSA